MTWISNSTNSGKSAISPVLGFAWFAALAVAIPRLTSRNVSRITTSKSAIGAIIMGRPEIAQQQEHESGSHSQCRHVQIEFLSHFGRMND